MSNELILVILGAGLALLGQLASYLFLSGDWVRLLNKRKKPSESSSCASVAADVINAAWYQDASQRRI